MARRINYVDLHTAIPHGGVLREDRDPLLALEVCRAEGTIRKLQPRIQLAGLPDHGKTTLVDAMVHVGNDRHIAQVTARRDGALRADSVSDRTVVNSSMHLSTRNRSWNFSCIHRNTDRPLEIDQRDWRAFPPPC